MVSYQHETVKSSSYNKLDKHRRVTSSEMFGLMVNQILFNLCLYQAIQSRFDSFLYPENGQKEKRGKKPL